MSVDQISDVALLVVKQYGEAHKELNYKQVYLLEQCICLAEIAYIRLANVITCEILMMKRATQDQDFL